MMVGCTLRQLLLDVYLRLAIPLDLDPDSVGDVLGKECSKGLECLLVKTVYVTAPFHSSAL